MNKTAQDLAKDIAKQIAQEPAEILKDAGEQLTGDPRSSESKEKPFPNPSADTLQEKNRDDAFTVRRTQALQNEIEDIRKQDIVSRLQSKISMGEEVPLEDYPELSMEQKQVLKAQMEAVKIQKQNEAYNASLQEVPGVHSKPSRRFGAGQKHEAEKAQTRVEKPIPPSG